MSKPEQRQPRGIRFRAVRGAELYLAKGTIEVWRNGKLIGEVFCDGNSAQIDGKVRLVPFGSHIECGRGEKE